MQYFPVCLAASLIVPFFLAGLRDEEQLEGNSGKLAEGKLFIVPSAHSVVLKVRLVPEADVKMYVQLA